MRLPNSAYSSYSHLMLKKHGYKPDPKGRNTGVAGIDRREVERAQEERQTARELGMTLEEYRQEVGSE